MKMGTKEPSGSLKKHMAEYKTWLNRAKKFFETKWNVPEPVIAKNEDFERIRPIGKGGFAVVMLIKSKFSQEYFAMKIMHRESILKNKGLITHILNEKKILTSLMPSSTIAKLVYCFKDNSYLYMVLEFLNGGTLYDYIYAYGRCGDYQAKYYAAQMILALQYLHHLEVLHRDIKLENIILDSHGIAKLTDFTFAKRIKLRTYTICGTVHYMAPEVLGLFGYGKAAEYWSLGILIYELCHGFPPFDEKDHLALHEQIMSGKYAFYTINDKAGKHMPLTNDYKDIVRNLLQQDLTRRIGNLRNGINDIKGHKWFAVLDWNRVYDGTADSPFEPDVSGPNDSRLIKWIEEPVFTYADEEVGADDFADF